MAMARGTEERAAGRRVTLRLGERELAALGEARRRWGLSDDSEALRESLRRAVEGVERPVAAASHAEAVCQTEDDARPPVGEVRQTRATMASDGPAERLTAEAELSDGLELWRLAAEEGHVACVGREDEIGRLRDVLGKRWRNSALLVGPRGVGKTAIVRGLAAALASDGGCPRDVVWLVTNGAVDDGGRLRTAAAVALASMGRRVVWEVDAREYEGMAERPEVAEWFEVVKVVELSREATVAALAGHVAALEAHHGVTVSDEVVELAAAMAQNVVEPKVLPGTAVDVLDEAASRARRLRGGEAGVAVAAEDVAEVAARRSGTRLEKIWRR